ncbi:hypothetical protein [Yoonia sp. 208BN28-4]|uniref:hypothetical protein n=1 Tax=Yoonia sp. 208BN28-4 TaxID=3126505 RepID=UPI0030A7111D
MNIEKIFRYGLIGGAAVVVVGLGGGYWYASSQPIGDECPMINTLPNGMEFQDRVRSEQRLDTSFDLLPVKSGPEVSCLKVFGQARCDVEGPKIVAAQTGFNGTPEIYDIPEGRTAVVRLSNSRMICVLLDP